MSKVTSILPGFKRDQVFRSWWCLLQFLSTAFSNAESQRNLVCGDYVCKQKSIGGKPLKVNEIVHRTGALCEDGSPVLQFPSS